MEDLVHYAVQDVVGSLGELLMTGFWAAMYGLHALCR